MKLFICLSGEFDKRLSDVNLKNKIVWTSYIPYLPSTQAWANVISNKDKKIII